jgi:translin
VDTSPLGTIAQRLRDYLTEKHEAREVALSLCREVVRLSANAVRSAHRREFAGARDLLSQARAKLEQADEALQRHRDVYYAGFVHDAAKEYAEAACTLALLSGGPLPAPEELGVEAQAYLNGLGEAVGELRRHLLDMLRQGDLARCEETLAAMSDIYDALVTMDYPEAVTGGLRRTTDAVRATLERTRGDFTLAYVQRRLEERLDALLEGRQRP